MNEFENINTINDLLDLENYINSNRADEIPQGKITASRLTKAWESGILNDVGYIFLIMTMFIDQEDLLTFSISDIVELWSGQGINGKKPKELKPESVNKALIDIYYADLIDIKNLPDILEIELDNKDYG
jgi:hypothetical protein